MVISVIGIRFCCQLYLRRLGPSPYLQPTRERESESESDSESDSADTVFLLRGRKAPSALIALIVKKPRTSYEHVSAAAREHFWGPS